MQGGWCQGRRSCLARGSQLHRVRQCDCTLVLTAAQSVLSLCLQRGTLAIALVCYLLTAPRPCLSPSFPHLQQQQQGGDG